MSQNPTSPIAICFNPACPSPGNAMEAQICSGCSADLKLQARYTAVRVLGRGGFSRTLLALDRWQTPMIPCVIQQRWRGNDPRQSERLPQPNLQRLMRLATQAQLPTILDGFVQDGVVYLIQEYIPGINLAIALNEHGSFSPTEICTILESLLSVLQYCHAQGIIHRDIKPENIIQQGQLVTASALFLVDFGSAEVVTPTSTILPAAIVGSPEYAAPEQLVGRAVFASDLYSLGVTCLHLLTGISPLSLFDRATNQWIWRDYWLPGPRHEHDRLAVLLDQLVAPALSDRLASAESAIAAMRGLQQQKRSVVIPSHPSSVPSPGLVCSTTLKGHSGLFASINAVAFSPDGTILASASDDCTVRLWAIQPGKALAVLRGHTKPVRTVAFHPHTNTVLVSGGRDRTIQVWDLVERRSIRTLIGHQHQVNTLAFSPDGLKVASGSADKTIQLWDFATGERLTTLTGHQLAVNAIAFSPTRPILVSASADSTVQVWNLDKFERLVTLAQHTAAVCAIAFSPDGKILATAGEDRTIQLWDTELWQPIRTLSGHPWLVSALTFSPDSTVLFSGSWDQTIKGWQVATGKECIVQAGHTHSVTCMAISPIAHLMASGSKDKTIKLWVLPTMRVITHSPTGAVE